MLGALRRIKASLTFEGTPEEVERFQRTARRLEDRYLVDEFNWVLDGYDIADLNEYLLSIGRVGVPDSTSPLARPSGRCTAGGRASLERIGSTYTQNQQEALRLARQYEDAEKYDVVVVDEAQDLKPVGLRLALAMVPNP